MAEKTLVSFSGVVKIYVSNSTRTPNEHSCFFSLLKVNSDYFLQVEGGIRRNRLKVKGHNIRNVVTKRLQEGYLTITFEGVLWETIAISKASTTSLKLLRSCLEGIEGNKYDYKSGQTTFPSGFRMKPIIAPNSAEKYKTPLLMKHPNNWRRASMATVGTGTSDLRKSAGGFYGSTSPEEFLPGCMTAPSRSKMPLIPNTPPYFSARRSLCMEVGKTGTESTTEDLGDFERTPKFRQPNPFQERTPLCDLSEKKGNPPPTNTVVSLTNHSTDGFANLGNTCYMNSVLQSLVGLEPFAEDILNSALVQAAAQSGSLIKMLYLLVKSKRSKDSYQSQKILLKKIKAAISQSTSKFNSYRQQDAHELLGQCLDQLKEEVRASTPSIFPGSLNPHSSPASSTSSDPSEQDASATTLCPVVRNFECEILHTIACKRCGKETKKSEVIYDFGLQLPPSVFIRPNQQANLQQLFEEYFSEEEVEYACNTCEAHTAILRHQLSRLPRVIILHLKRYGYSAEHSRNSKRVDHIRIPRSINTGELCASKYDPPIEFKGPWPRGDLSLSSLVTSDKENSNPRLPAPATPFPLVHVTAPATPSPLTHVTTPTSKHVPLPPIIHPLKSFSIPDDSPRDRLCSPTTSSPVINTLSHYPMTLDHKEADGGAMATDNATPNPLEDLSQLGKRRSCESESDDTWCKSSEMAVKHQRVGFCQSARDSKLSYQTCRGGSQSNDDSYRSPEEHREEREAQRKRSKGKVKGEDGVMDAFDDLAYSSLSFEFSAVPGDRSTFDSITSQPGSSATTSQTSTASNTNAFGFNSGTNNTYVCLSGTSPSAVRATSTIVQSDSNLPNHTSTSHSASNSAPASPSVAVSSKEVTPSTLTAPTDSAEISEEEEIKRAMEESLKGQLPEFQLLHQMGMSEDEQLKLALDLSIKEVSVVNETPPTSPMPCVAHPSPVLRAPSNIETYRLVSIVSHLGRGSGGGHYISDVCSISDKSWKTYNDTVVSEVREEDMRQLRQTTGYIFFYMHRSTYNSIKAGCQ